MSFDRDRARLAAVLVLTAGMAFAISPFLTDGFNGFTADQFPIPQVDAPIQPAGWAFSIWGLIYVWLLIHAVFGMVMLIAALIALHLSPRSDRGTAQAPVASYAGWLTAASFVSLGLTLAGYGILLDAVGWAGVGLIALSGFAIAYQRYLDRAPEYSLTVIWALCGVVAGNLAGRPVIAGLAVVAIAALALPLIRRRSAMS